MAAFMKNILFCLLLLFSVDYATAQVYLAKQQAYEDIDSFYSKLAFTHPRMYWKTPKVQVDAFVADLKKQCGDSIRADEFSILMSQGNCLFDAHTGVQPDYNNYVGDYIQKYGDAVFPLVDCSEKGLFMKGTGNRIVSINGYPADELVRFATNELGGDENPNNVNAMLSNLPELQKRIIYKGIKAPFQVVIEGKDGRDVAMQVKGVSLMELGQQVEKALWIYYQEGVHSFETYPEQSVAIIRFNVCDTTGGLDRILSDCFKQVAKDRIENVFIDVSMNGGGTTQACEMLLDHLCFRGNVKAVIGERDGSSIKYLESSYKKNNKEGYKGKVYVYQSFLTASSGTFISEMLKSVKRAALVGTETGGCVPVYTNKDEFSLKNSDIMAFCATMHYYKAKPALPRDKNGFLLPDISYPFELGKRLELSDCLKIIGLNDK